MTGTHNERTIILIMHTSLSHNYELLQSDLTVMKNNNYKKIVRQADQCVRMKVFISCKSEMFVTQIVSELQCYHAYIFQKHRLCSS